MPDVAILIYSHVPTPTGPFENSINGRCDTVRQANCRVEDFKEWMGFEWNEMLISMRDDYVESRSGVPTTAHVKEYYVEEHSEINILILHYNHCQFVSVPA